MKTFLKHLSTGIDNSTYDVGRVALILGVVAFVVYTGWAVWHTRVFDAQAFGIGYGSLAGGGGALLKLKENTEPAGGDA